MDTPQSLFHLRSGAVGEYCFGLIGKGLSRNKVCCKKRSACDVKGHLSPKIALMEEAFYIKSRGSSVLLWPFVFDADLATAGEDDFLTSRSTSEHVECMHRFYESNTSILKNVLTNPRVASMVGRSTMSALPKSSNSVTSGASFGSGVLVPRARSSGAASVHSRASLNPGAGLIDELEQEADVPPPQISFKLGPADTNSLDGILLNSEAD